MLWELSEAGDVGARDRLRSSAPLVALARRFQLRHERRQWHRPGVKAAPFRGIGTRFLCAIGVSLWSVMVAGAQVTPPGVLPAELRAHLRDERFGIVTSIRGLPLGVREALQKLFDSRTLDIAEPGAEFQRTDVLVTPNLPIRRLAVAGCSSDHCLVYYERGGFAHTWHAALFHWTPAATRLEWGGSAPGGLATIDDVRSGMLSGAIKGDKARF
jgi:hypothetical protein